MEERAPTDTNERLRAMGLRTPVEQVLLVAARLERGEPLYPLYTAQVSKGEEKPRINKRTALKIKRLWEAGRLKFLFEKPEETVLRGTAALAQALLHAVSIARVPSSRFVPVSPFETVKLERERRKCIIEALPQHDWSVIGIEKAGIEPWMAIHLLKMYDILKDQVDEALLAAESDDTALLSRELVTWYVQLHYMVQFHKDCLPEVPPGSAIAWASSWFAEGVTADNEWLMQLGKNVMRYAIWRGDEHAQAFLERLSPFRQEVLDEIRRNLDKHQRFSSIYKELLATRRVSPPEITRQDYKDEWEKYLNEEAEWVTRFMESALERASHARDLLREYDTSTTPKKEPAPNSPARANKRAQALNTHKRGEKHG
jgi:hypothetical protein